MVKLFRKPFQKLSYSKKPFRKPFKRWKTNDVQAIFDRIVALIGPYRDKIST